jgi:hypothetical protein
VPDLPDLLRDAARDTLEALQQLMLVRGQALADHHADTFEQYRRDLEAAFFAYSELPEPATFDPRDPPPVIERQWNPLAFHRQGQAETLESFAAMMDVLREVDADDFRETLDEAADEGYARELWMLSLAGMDTEGLVDFVPDDWEATLRDGSVEGQDWESRLQTWNATTTDKMRRWLTATALAGGVWAATREGYTRLMQQHTGRVAGLFANETFRAFTAGAMVGLETARRELGVVIGEIWLCRTDASGRPDPLVCPVCKPLHMTVTTLRPIDDTHPGCRCLKVPVPAEYRPTAVPYSAS